MTFVEVELNGKKLLVPPQKTILEVAGEQGIEIPTLCHDPRLEPYGSCWVCLVRVEGAKGFVPACSTKVRQGMRIVTDAADIRSARRMALELLLSGHRGDCKAPCSQACPAGIDVQGYVGLIANGQYREALELIKENNPFPAVCGRVCPRPCEEACRRNLVDEPVAIDWLKRYAADLDLFGGQSYSPPPAPRNGKRVAVVGGGPAGLSAAYYLARRGVAVTVFESEAKAGGMLRYGIPDYRLPQDTLDLEIGTVLRLGVELKTGVRLGEHIHLDQLRREFDAVVLAMGAWKGRGLRIQGEDHPAVLSGIALLKDAALGKKITLGRRVAVIGGGNTAIDAARVSLRLGAEEVSIFYRRTDKEMPASAMEIHEALEEGVKIHYLVAPVGIRANGQGLESIQLLRMQLGEPDASGRRRPVEVKGSEFEVAVDNVIAAIGQYSDTRYLENVPGLVDEKGNVVCSVETGETAVAGLFVAGDLASGADIAIRAIAGGRRTADAVAAFLAGERPARSREFLLRKEDLGEVSAEEYRDTPRVPRQTMAVLDPQTRVRSFEEIEQGFSEDQARQEASRCLECGCQDVQECRLKRYSTDYGVVATRFLGEVRHHPIDSSHPYIDRDPSKCILCGRCIRICLEVQGIGALGYLYRGFKSLVGPSFNVPLGEDELCIGCGQCVSSCPVGALTEKRAGRKPVPVAERVEEGHCVLCSVACPVEYRFQGSRLSRVTGRFTADGGGRLCRKGRFEQGPFAEPEAAPDGVQPLLAGRPVGREEAAAALQAALRGKKKPLLRLSPLLAGEVIDRFLKFAAQEKLPVAPLGLEGLESGWAALAGAADGTDSFYQENGAGRRILLVGALDESNNVAFTDCLALKRGGKAELWAVAPGAAIYHRQFDRLFPEPADLEAALREASAAGGKVEVLLNPEDLLRRYGKKAEKAALEALSRAAGAAGPRVTLFWNSRNAGYLLRSLQAAGLQTGDGRACGCAACDCQTGKLAAALVDGAGAGEKVAVQWGLSGGEAELLVPMPRQAWLGGYTEPSGRKAFRAGVLDGKLLAGLLI